MSTRPQTEAIELLAQCVRCQAVVANTANDLAGFDSQKWIELRPIYAPLNGQHTGAVAETIIEDEGKTLTLYEGVGDEWELSLSDGPQAIDKNAIWMMHSISDAMVVMLTWDGKGEPMRGNRLR